MEYLVAFAALSAMEIVLGIDNIVFIAVLVGRLNGVHLSLRGRAQAKELADHFAREEIAAVLTSPRERAQV